MIKADTFIQQAKALGFQLFTGVPCSYLKPFINYTIDAEDLRYVGATNEGDAVAIAAGAELGGCRAVAMFQNSGLGNAVNPLTSLTYTFELPILLIPTLRGEPDGPKDEPQHELMGQITTAMLEAMQIPWDYFPKEDTEVAPKLEKAVTYMETHRKPYALVMQKGSVDKHPLQSKPIIQAVDTGYETQLSQAIHTRHEALLKIQECTCSNDLLIASTGYTGRELYACEDRENQLYMVGSMGCASSFGLGLALARPDKRIIVIDGDGAALMRLGAFATIAYERPQNLVHILLDNQSHESTGGQSTVSHSIDFTNIARSCGYSSVHRVSHLSELGALLQDNNHHGLRFIHMKIKPGILETLPRPSTKPSEVAHRMRNFLKNSE